MAWPDGRLEKGTTISGLSAPTSVPPAVGITHINRANGKIYKSIKTTNVLPYWKEVSRSYMIDVSEYGAVGDGLTDNSVALQAAWDSAIANDGLLFFPAGTYMIGTGISVAEGRWGAIGEGRRTSVIKASEAIDMFTCSRDDGSKSGSIVMQDIGFDGADAAFGGMIMQSMNMSRFQSVEIRNVDGIGLSLNNTEDCIFEGIEVRKCGNLSSTAGGVEIRGGIGATNSLSFHGGTIERSRYHGLIINGSHAIKILGMKLHGQIPLQDATTPNKINLLQATDCRRLQIVGNQFALANYRAVRFTGVDVTSSMTIANNSFFKTSNYQGVLQSGQTASMTVGNTACTISTAGSWSNGNAIRITGAGASGADLYSWIVSGAGTTSLVLNDAAGTTVSGTSYYTVGNAWNVFADIGHVHIQGNLFASSFSGAGNTHPSYMKEGGDIRFTDNVVRTSGNNVHEANPDNLVSRRGGLVQPESASMTAASTTCTLSAAGDWKNAWTIRIAGAGVSGADLYTSIVSGAGTTTLILNDAAGTTVSGAMVYTTGISRYKTAELQGDYWNWQDSDGNARRKDTYPTSNIDGTLVSDTAILTLANGATPTVQKSGTFVTGGTITITDFDDGYTGKKITILSEHAITITDGTNIFLNGSANFVMASGDSLTLIQKADGYWYEISRMVN